MTHLGTALPTGTVTFVFTDIEGSTRLLQELGEGYRAVQDEHDEIMRTAITDKAGIVVRTEGDSFFAVFPAPAQAVRAVVEAQQAIHTHTWPEGVELRVRIGIHTGEGTLGGDDYLGLDVNRAARIGAAGHGGQLLISGPAAALVEHSLPAGVELRDLGSHRLKDLAHPERIYQVIIAGLSSDFPALRSTDARPNNLPLQLTSLVGRTDEIAATIDMLERHRLVTLTGPGGTGKTRLAVEVAGRLLHRFQDGVYLVELAAFSDPAQVPSVVAQTLGVKEGPGRSLSDALADWLSDKEVLVVLDNFEQLLEAASVVGQLLGLAPGLKVLVTSRAPLQLYGQHELPVPPLRLSAPDDERENVLRSEAATLFVERAQAIRPTLDLSEDTVRAIAELCIRLDGLPLAIELAARRVNILSPRAILARLSTGLDSLAASSTDLPARQRTLRTTIQWSFDLLGDQEKVLFPKLAAFSDGADLDAIETVVDPDRQLDVIETLGKLVDSSLVMSTDSDGGEPRFAMLQTIHEFAEELLDTGSDAGTTRRRHADLFLEMAIEGERHLTGRDQADWLRRFEIEQGNLETALRWSLETGETERGLEAASAMWRYYQQRGRLAVGRSWVERLLAASGAGPSRARAAAHLAAGGLAFWQADYDPTADHYQRALAMYEGLGDKPGIAEATYDLAFVPVMISDEPFDRGFAGRPAHLIAMGRLEEALRLFEELGDLGGVAKTKGNMALFIAGSGDMKAGSGEMNRALLLLEEAIAAYRELGDMFHLADALTGLAQGHLIEGRHAEARQAVVEAIALFADADNKAGIGLGLETLSFVEAGEGRQVRALRLLAKAEEIRATKEGDAKYPVPASVFYPEMDVPGDARAAIGDDAAERELAAGRSMSLAEAVAYAMEA
jgi:predicted ATPase/class 3 adenylate cyclase